MSIVTELAGFWRDVEVARVSGSGTDISGARVESIPDQSAVGRADMQGRPVLALPSGNNALVFAGLAAAALVAIKLVK